MRLHKNIFCHRLSDHLHCTNRPFTYALRKDMSMHSNANQNVHRLENNLLNANEISRKSNLNRTRGGVVPMERMFSNGHIT